MKPPKDPFNDLAPNNYIAAIDSQTELDVVERYAHSRDYWQKLNDSGVVFNEYTVSLKEVINPAADIRARHYDESTHKHLLREGEEVPLTHSEASIALSAAVWLLDRKNPISQAKNLLNGRRKAATEMLNYLFDLGVERWRGIK